MSIKIKSIKEIKLLIHDSGGTKYYRGESKLFKKPITCGICRSSKDIEKIRKYEKLIFNEFVSEVVLKEASIQKKFSDSYSYENEWNYLFQGQHLGLHTRLVDWTVDWKIALLFAVNEWSNDCKDGHFWIFNCPENVKVNLNTNDDIYNKSVFDLDESYMINPVLYHHENEEYDYIGRRRMNRQFGRFFIQPLVESIKPLNKRKIFKRRLTHLIIDSESKPKIRKELVKEGCYLSDWIYYKNDCFISNQIKTINTKFNFKSNQFNGL